MLRNLIGYGMFLFFSNFLSGQDTLFFEDFNTCELSANWTYELTGYQNVSWGVGLPSNTKAEASSIDGTCMLFIDDDLTGDKTPPFKLRLYSKYFDGSDYSDISLKAQVHFRRDKTEYMRIIIDNGKKEHVVREFKGRNYDGEKFSDFIDMDTDLSFIASDSMRIIIEYDDDNQWGWWAGIDNMSVTGKTGGKIVLGETFNECILPQGWTTEILNGEDDWNFNIFTDGRSIDGTCFAFFNDDVLGKEAPLSKIRLYSPKFSAYEFANYQLTYDFIFRFYEASEYLQLYVDNGKEWQTVKTYNGDFGGPNVDASKKDTIDLSPFRDENIRLIWEYNDGGWAWWLGMDNVKITGQGDINDRCNKAISLVPDGNCLPFNNTFALRDDEFDAVSGDHTGFLYYHFNAPESASYQIQTKTSFNDIIEVYTGNCQDKTEISIKNKDEYGFQGEDIFIETTAGQDYIIRVYGKQAEFGLDKGNGCIAFFKKDEITIAPTSDVCQNAILVEEGTDCLGSININALLDGMPPTTNLRSRADVWFTFIPEITGNYIFKSHADFADALAIFEGDCNNLLETSSNFSGQEILINNAEAHKIYFIQVTGYFSTLEGKLCPQIEKVNDSPVLNTKCSDALALTINGVCNSQSNIGAGFSGIQPSCDVYIHDDVWYTFIAPPTNQVYLKVKTDFENIVSVYEGTCDALQSVFCEKNIHHCNGFMLINHLEAGKQYFLQLGSKELQKQYKSGAICIEIKDTEPVWEKIQLNVAQECVSKGAVVFTPAASGGSGLYTYSGLGINEPTAGNDQYIIEAKDEEGCVAAVLVQAQSCNDFGCTVATNVTKLDLKCFGEEEGSVIIDVSGGLEPYQAAWSNGMTGFNINNLQAGQYFVTISDGSGCELLENIQINQPAQILTNPSFTSPLCYNDSSGLISLFVIGGNGPFTYKWEDGNLGSSLQNIPGGDYEVTISDALGCIVTEEYILVQPDEISASAEVVNNLCYGEKLGSITPEIKGGTSPYSYEWEDGDMLNLDSLEAGIYTITVTDKNGCSASKSWELSQPNELELKLDSIDLEITNTKNALINISMEGGIPPYQFEWFYNDVAIDEKSDEIITDQPGVYYIVVKDGNDCVFTSQYWEVNFVSSTQDVALNVSIRPNPVSDVLNITLSNPTVLDDIKLMDLNGKVLITVEKPLLQQIEINVREFISGTYFLTWKQGGKIYAKKIVVIH